MKEIKIRYSKQRELIFNNLKHRYDHPTAEMIYQDLKVDYHHLSLGTVYRNLNQLVETKQIKKLDLGDTMVHYDGNIQPHMHFMCNCCQTIYDLDNNDKKLSIYILDNALNDKLTKNLMNELSSKKEVLSISLNKESKKSIYEDEEL